MPDFYRNGQRDPDAVNPPYGIADIPQTDDGMGMDIYKASAPASQQGWNGGWSGSPATTAPAGPTGQSGPSPYAPPSAQQEQRRSQLNQPPTAPNFSGANYVGMALSHRPGLVGIIASILNAGNFKKQNDYEQARQSFNDQRQQQMIDMEQQRLNKPTAHQEVAQQQQAQEQQILAQPDVQKYRAESGLPLDKMNPGELQAGLARQHAEELGKATQPGKEALQKERLDAAERRQKQREDEIDFRLNQRLANKPDPKNFQEKDYTGNDGETYTRVFDSTTGKSFWRDAEGNQLAKAPKLARSTRLEPPGPKATGPAADVQGIRESLIKKGDYEKLAEFEKQDESSGMSPATKMKGSRAGGVGAPAHGPLAPALTNFHVNPQTGERIGWDGTEWVPAPQQ